MLNTLCQLTPRNRSKRTIGLRKRGLNSLMQPARKGFRLLRASNLAIHLKSHAPSHAPSPEDIHAEQHLETNL
jgi:hypothetical protein